MGGVLIVPRPKALAWDDILAWSRAHYYGEEDAAMLDECLTRMDAKFLAWWHERNTPKGDGA